MIRTAPVTAVAPDPIRAMERLEAQLRRAADDLAETLTVLREVAIEEPALLTETGLFLGRPRCGKWMPNAKDHCARFAGHGDKSGCRTREAMDNETVQRWHARHG